MSGDTVALLIDLSFTAIGLTAAAAQLVRRPPSSPGEAAPPPSWSEIALTSGGLLAAAVGPNVLVVATTPGMPEMAQLARYALLPSLGFLVIVWSAASALALSRLRDRVRVGVWAGAAATGALDAVRLTGFHLGLMPGNMPRMFGVMFLDRMALGPSLTSDLIGYVYHYWVGACFGLTYTLLCGRFRWWGGLIWGLLIEVGMMVTPPMVVAMDTGYFGSKFGPGLFGTSLIAHVAYGVLLGLLVEIHVAHRGTIVRLLCDLISGPRTTDLSPGNAG